MLLGLAGLLSLSFEVAADRRKDSAEQIGRFFAAQEAADEFAGKLALEGKTGQDALTMLSAQGFQCDVRLVRFGMEEKRRPLIGCSRAPSEIHDDCLSLRVNVSLKHDRRRTDDELLRQAPSSPIDVVSATCRTK